MFLAILKGLGAVTALYGAYFVLFGLVAGVPSLLSFKLTFLQGMKFDELMRVFWRAKFAIHPLYWPRAIFVTVTSLYTSQRAQIEDKKYKAKLEEMELKQSPVFVIGHYRQGTTLIHEILALDTDQFVFPTVFQAWQPSMFLHTERYVYKKMGKEKIKRPMDNMLLTLESPQEDEFALCNLHSLSPYIYLVFPSLKEWAAPFVTFRKATEAQRKKWKDTFNYYLKKIAFRNPDKTILLKSPIHTARIRLILEVFPDAKFVHVYRNPYAVFLSSRHLHVSLFSHFNLQKLPSDAVRDEQILDHYDEMYTAFLEDKHLIPKKNLVEVSFEDYTANMVEKTKEIYSTLGLRNWDKMEPVLVKEADKRKSFKPNKFKKLDPKDAALVKARWGRFIKEFGYPENPPQ